MARGPEHYNFLQQFCERTRHARWRNYSCRARIQGKGGVVKGL